MPWTVPSGETGGMKSVMEKTIAAAASTFGMFAFALTGVACSSTSGGAGRSSADGAAAAPIPVSGNAPANGSAPGDDAGAAAAGDDSGSADDAADAAVNCANDPRVDAYSPNLMKSGKAGNFQFILVGAQPAPPGLGINTWTLKIVDASGNAVTDATFPKGAIKPWMPDMRHGSSIIPSETSNNDGTYSIGSLYLFMPGIWQVTFAPQAGSVQDSAVFTFCVP